MTEKVQRLGENHHNSLFHHGLVKVLVCHQLSHVELSWDDFSNSSFPSSSPTMSSDESTSPNSPMQQEVASSRKPTKGKYMAEVVKTYSGGEGLVFYPNIFERAKPAAGEQRASSEHEEFTHPGTNVSDLEKGYDDRVSNQIIRDKEVDIKRLENKLIKVYDLIACFK